MRWPDLEDSYDDFDTRSEAEAWRQQWPDTPAVIESRNVVTRYSSWRRARGVSE